jgi:hypothetical protein
MPSLQHDIACASYHFAIERSSNFRVSEGPSATRSRSDHIASLARGSQALPAIAPSDREFIAIPIELNQQSTPYNKFRLGELLTVKGAPRCSKAARFSASTPSIDWNCASHTRGFLEDRQNRIAKGGTANGFRLIQRAAA